MDRKKRFLWFAILAFLLVIVGFLINISHVKALDLTDTQDKLNQAGEVLTDDEARANYLKTEWTKLLANPKLKSFLEWANKIMTYLNPLWLTILGMEFSFSWLFFLTLIIWESIIVYSYSGFLLLQYSLPYRKTKFLRKFKIIWLLIAIALFCVIRLPMGLAKLIITFFSGRGEWYNQLILIILLTALFIFIMIYHKQIKKTISRYNLYRRLRELEDKKKIKELIERDKKLTNEEKEKLKEENDKEMEELKKDLAEDAETYKDLFKEKDDYEDIMKQLKRLRKNVRYF